MVLPSPLVGEGAERSEAGEGSLSASEDLSFVFARRNPSSVVD
jgi:hypothetical protein